MMSYCSIQDPAVALQSGYNDKHGTAVWGRGGKVKVHKLYHTLFDPPTVDDRLTHNV